MENKQNDKPNQEENTEQAKPITEQQKTKEEINPNNITAQPDKQTETQQKRTTRRIKS